MTTPRLADRIYPDDVAASRLRHVISQYEPVAVYAMFSGGNDSLAATIVASQHPQFTGVAHVNTGIGIEETREYVRETCKAQGWPLVELHPPVSYDELVLKLGFPGPAGHGLMYQRLKERCVRQLVREAKAGHSRRAKVALVTGIRATESVRRMRNVDGDHDTEGSKLWCAPMYDHTAEHVRAIIAAAGIKTNPVSDLLHMSGECLCGSFAKPGEREMLRSLYPQVVERIEALEERVAEAGVAACRWGEAPRLEHWGQLNLGPLCYGCQTGAP